MVHLIGFINLSGIYCSTFRKTTFEMSILQVLGYNKVSFFLAATFVVDLMTSGRQRNQTRKIFYHMLRLCLLIALKL